MANPAWPAALPQFVLQDGYGASDQDQALETAMESGPAKSRRRFSKRVRRMSCVVACDEVTLPIFWTFWHTTCKGGTLPFDWVDPPTQAASTYLFRNPAPQETYRDGVTYVAFTLEEQ